MSALSFARAALTALYPLQSSLPPALAKQWRLAITLLFHAIPAIDPSKDTYLTQYEPPARCGPPAPAGQTALLITGGTGELQVEPVSCSHMLLQPQHHPAASRTHVLLSHVAAAAAPPTATLRPA